MIIALQILGGLALLVGGGEGLVRGAVSLAKELGVTPIIIGLTIISAGTSAPEMVISVHAALTGHPDIALGNVVGSNIANILLVLGPAAMITPIVCKPELIKREGVLLLLLTVALVGLCIDGEVSQWEGVTLLVIMGAYLFDLWRNVKRNPDPELVEDITEEVKFEDPLWKALLFLAGGMTLLVLGADILVDGASTLARQLGVSEAVIGLTILAIGTSAPELVTSMVAAYHKHADIAIGNVVGSNIFNIVFVMGVASTITTIPVASNFLSFDLWFMLSVSFILLPIMITGRRIDRMEGALFFAAYCGYTYYQYAQLV